MNSRTILSLNSTKAAGRRAFTLVEVTLALGVACFCLLPLVGLLPLGLSSNQTSLNQTVAGNIGGAIFADMRSVQPLGSGTSARFGIVVPAVGGSSSIKTTPQIIYLAADGNATDQSGSGTVAPVYRATVGFAPPAGGLTATRTATVARVLITWPALSGSDSSGWPTNYSGSYEAETTLDRN